SYASIPSWCWGRFKRLRATINLCCVFYKYLRGLRQGNYCFWIVPVRHMRQSSFAGDTRDRYRGVIDNYLRPIFGNLCPKHVAATISTATATTSATMSKRIVFIFGGISKGLLQKNLFATVILQEQN